MKKILFCLAIAVTAASLSTSALADSDAGLYVAGSIGYAKNANAGGALTRTSDTDYSLVGGYEINKNLAAEISYTDLGSTAQIGATGKQSAISLTAVGKMPVAEKCALVGRLGYANAVTDLSTGAKAKQNGLTFGVGGQYSLTSHVSLVAAWNRLKVGDNVSVAKSNVDTYSLGASYSF